MRTAKGRKHDKERKRKALSATRTDESRQRRLDNKAKRDEILNINPNLKITIVDGIIYTDDGINGKVAVKVIDGKIRSNDNEPEIFIASDEGEVNVIEKIEAHNKSAIQRLTDRFRKK